MISVPFVPEKGRLEECGCDNTQQHLARMNIGLFGSACDGFWEDFQ